jgi:hypothetical protein
LLTGEISRVWLQLTSDSLPDFRHHLPGAGFNPTLFYVGGAPETDVPMATGRFVRESGAMRCR